MRIALFTETYPPQINGVATHVKSLKDGLEQLGHQVLIVTADINTATISRTTSSTARPWR